MVFGMAVISQAIVSTDWLSLPQTYEAWAVRLQAAVVKDAGDWKATGYLGNAQQEKINGASYRIEHWTFESNLCSISRWATKILESNFFGDLAGFCPRLVKQGCS